MPPVQTLWRRLDTPGHDAARLISAGDRWRLEGRAVFRSPDGPASLDYHIDLSRDWATLAGQVQGFVGGRDIDWRIERRADDWYINNEAQGFPELVDLDYGFTPATNFGQIQRFNLSPGQETDLSVLWFDAESDTLRALPQYYRRTGEAHYDYRSPDGDYHATLELLDSGFVRLYPGLWQAEV